MTAADVGRLAEAGTIRRLVLDDVVLTYVTDGVMLLDVDAFFPGVPARHWREHRADLAADTGRPGAGVPAATGGLLVERAGRRLLIDAGYGAYDGDTPMGPVHCGSLPAALAWAGASPELIDTVALTHLHVDHVGWLFHPVEQGSAPWFPNARYVVAGSELAGQREPAGLGDADRAGVVVPLRRRAETIADGDEIFIGVRALVTPGHSAGHTSYVVTTGTGRRLVAFGDAFHLPAQLAHPDWVSRPDALPGAVPAARARVLAELTVPGTLGFGMHFGDQPFGRVARVDGRPAWIPVPSVPLHRPAS